MARKQLIKGVNAARLEERIARVPADLGPKLSPEQSIFGAITKMEKDENTPKVKPKPSRRKAARPKPEAQPKLAKPPEPGPRPESAQLSRIGPSDFSNAERETILRCCEDYRNRLPIYLLSVQCEVKVIDAVIEKCKAAKRK
jgi:hypothetical protein